MNHYSQQILKDLSVSQSTADSIAGRIGITDQRCEALLRELKAEGYVTVHPLEIDGKDALAVYRLTEKSRA
jgi:predicted transcriptional regulator